MTSTDTTRAFDGKAEVYARHRLDYAPQAIEAILAVAGLGKRSTIADLGAGTGMLTRHFADRVGQVFAIEPNDEMRAVASTSLRGFASVRVLGGMAHATGLPDHSVDAVTAGRSIQWFDPVPSRAEIQRVLRPGGWLIVVRTPVTDAYSSAAIDRLRDERISHRERDRRQHQAQTDVTGYFGGDNCIHLSYPCETRETWPQFLGRIQSLSTSPRPGEPKYGEFARVAREIFDGGAMDGVLRFEYATEVLMKQVATAKATAHPFPLREAEIERDIVTRFEAVAARFPAGIAVKAGAEECSYAELDRLADGIAGVVLREAPDRAAPVALLFEHGIGGIASILGVLKAGRAYCAMSLRHPLERHRQTLADLRPGLLLHSPAQRAMAETLARDGLRCALVDLRAIPDPDHRPESVRTADDIAAVYYTSGTTGGPKGIAHNHRQLLHRAWLSAQRLDVVPGCRMSQIAELAFFSAAADVLVPLLSGATICPFDAARNSLRQLAQWLRDDRIEVVRVPVALFHQLLDALDEGECFPHVRFLQPAGKLYWPSVDRYRRHFTRECRLVRQLAATETSLLATMMVDHDTPRVGASVPVGYPVPGKELWLEDTTGKRAGIDETGEIVVKSRYLFAGVWGRPDTFLGAGEDRLHRTGDLGRWLPDGSLEFVGRADSRVKIRGFTVDLDEVEAAIEDTGLVVDSAVLANEDAAGAAQLVAYVVPAKPQLTPGEVRTLMAARVPDYMIPSRIVHLDVLPLTANGKVDRAALAAAGHSRQEGPASRVAPGTPMQAGIAAIWEGVLGSGPIGVDEDFLAIGGDSLAAARIANEILSAFRVELSPREVFDAPTIARMAELVVRRQTESSGAAEA